MDTFEAVETRRSVKKFDPDHEMSAEEIDRLMRATILSPTSYNIQNWRFVLVTDREQKDAVRKVGWNQAQFSDCSLLVVVCGDLEAYARDPERYWRNAPEAARAAIVPMIAGCYEGDERARRDEALRSGGMAAQTLMLAAQAMGYDTCPMTGFDFAEVAGIIGLPPDHEIVMAVAVGRGVEPARERSGRIPYSEAVVRERFPSPGSED